MRLGSSRGPSPARNPVGSTSGSSSTPTSSALRAGASWSTSWRASSTKAPFSSPAAPRYKSLREEGRHEQDTGRNRCERRFRGRGGGSDGARQGAAVCATHLRAAQHVSEAAG